MVTATGLATGTYTGTMNIAVQGGPSFPVTITFTVSSARQALGSSQSSLLFQVAAAAGPPPAQSIVVLNEGSGSLNWTAKASTLVGNWLSVAPSAGASGDSATVSVDPANLQPGDYLERILYGVKPSDPLTFAIVFAIMLGVGAAAATFLPARRATRIDPM